MNNIPLGDIAFKQIVTHDELLISFLNAFFEYNKDTRRVVKVISEIVEETKCKDKLIVHVDVIAYLANGNKLPMHLCKDGDGILIAIAKEIEDN